MGIRITLALTAWLFAWTCWSFAIAQLLGGHAFRGATRSVLVEVAQQHDAVYLGMNRFARTNATLHYTWSDSRIENWWYLMTVGRREWPHWSGFQWCRTPTFLALRLPWWFVLLAPAAALIATIQMARRAARRADPAGDAHAAAADDGAPAPRRRTLSYALPDMSGQLERRLRFMTVACAAVCILILTADLVNGPRARLAGWMDLVQVLAAMAATLAAANLLASPGFRGRRRRVIMLAAGCFIALAARLLLPTLR